MKITDFMSKKELQGYMDRFSDATDLAVVMVDIEGNPITNPSNVTDFCVKYTKGSAEGSKRCKRHERDEVGTGIYRCHMDLMEFVIEIKVEGEHVASVKGGQVFTSEPDQDKLRKMAREWNINPDSYIEAAKKVPIRSEKAAKAASDMIGDMMNKIANLAYMQSKGTGRIDVIQDNVKSALEAVDSINEKTKFLQTVASRQNILTLNATIESARAGDAGRGFSVVATQMGDLSRKSSEIYKGITDDADAITKAVQTLDKALAY